MKPTILFLFTMLSLSTALGQELPRWSLPAQVKVFTTVEPEQVKLAVETWQSFLPDGLSLVYVGPVTGVQNCEGCVTVTREAVAGKRRGETWAYNYEGVSSYAIIRIDPRVKGDQFQRDVEHELGHALGLPHYSSSIMQEKESKRHPAEIDAERLQAIYSLIRYSFRRVATIGSLRRESVFTWNDRGEQIETQIVGSNDEKFKTVPLFPVGLNSAKAWAASDQLNTFTVTWKDGLVQDRDLLFPVEAWKGNIHVTFSDYRLFRVSVAIREIP